MRINLFYDDPEKLFSEKVDKSSIHVSFININGAPAKLYTCNTFAKRVQVGDDGKGRKIVYAEYCSPGREEKTFSLGWRVCSSYWLHIYDKMASRFFIYDLSGNLNINALAFALVKGD